MPFDRRALAQRALELAQARYVAELEKMDADIVRRGGAAFASGPVPNAADLRKERSLINSLPLDQANELLQKRMDATSEDETVDMMTPKRFPGGL